MVTRILKADVQKGMFVEAVECPESLFGKRRFMLLSDADVKAIRECPAEHVVINSSVGTDVLSRRIAAARQGSDTRPATRINGRAEAAALMAESVQLLRYGLFGIATTDDFDLEQLTPMIQDLAHADNSTTSLFFEVTRLKDKDQTTFQHSLAVSILMGKLGDALELGSDAVELLVLSGMLHDVGKLAISNDILQKQAKLTAAERLSIQRHPRHGHQILLKYPELPAEVLEICLHHHEYLDGSGYPSRMKGSDIDLLVRIATVCDVFEALTSARPYKRGWRTADALAWMFERDHQFDRKLVLRLGACIEG